MSSILEKNLSYIEKYNNDLANKIRSHNNLNANFELVNSKSGDIVLKREGFFVNDEIDPVSEAYDLFYSIGNNTIQNLTVVYGLNLTYAMDVFSIRSKGKIIFYEPDLDFLRITFEYFDLSDYLSNINVRVANSFKEIEQIYEEFFFYDYKLSVAYSNYNKSLNLSEINLFINEISSLHGIYQSNYTNLFKKSHFWTRSTIINTREIVNHRDLHEIKDKFKGKTAVIISAGPSLDKNIQYIKDYRDKVIVFCVGTALKAVYKKGIVPDFITVVEFYDSTNLQFKDIDLSKVNLIVHPMAYLDIHQLNTKNTFNYYSNNDNAVKFLANLWNIDTKEYINKGTVAVMALFSAKMIGCNNIIFIGQDLAYTNGDCYAKETIYGDYKLSKAKEKVEVNVEAKAKELNIHEVQIQDHLEVINSLLLEVKGYYGDSVTTRSDFALFIKYFEQIANEYNKELNLINSTEGGAYLEGFSHIPLKDALEKYAVEEVSVNNILKDKLNPLLKKNRKIKLLKALQQTNKNYLELKPLVEEMHKRSLLLGEKYSSTEDLISQNKDEYNKTIRTYINSYNKVRQCLMKDEILSNVTIAPVLKLERYLNIKEASLELEILIFDSFKQFWSQCFGHYPWINDIIIFLIDYLSSQLAEK